MTKEQKAKRDKALAAKRQKRLDEWVKFLKDNDCDGDFDSIFRILIFKLSRQRKAILNNKYAGNYQHIHDTIKSIEDKIITVQNEENFEQPFKDFEAKYGILKETKVIYNPDGSSTHTYKREKETDENEKEVRREARKAYRDCHKLRVKMLKDALNQLAENIWDMWD